MAEVRSSSQSLLVLFECRHGFCQSFADTAEDLRGAEVEELGVEDAFFKYDAFVLGQHLVTHFVC